MDKDQLLEWRKVVVTQMLSTGICIEQIIPDVIIAEEFISTGEYPENWKNQQLIDGSTSVIPKGTHIKINSVPFVLQKNAFVDGEAGDIIYALSLNQDEVLADKPTEAQVDKDTGMTNNLSSESI